MTHVLLGLLLIAPQSLYELVRNFRGGAGLFYSASTGSIKRGLDLLLERDFIEVASVESGGRGKKTYRITDAGRADFHRWMTGEVTGSDLETAALSRLFFLGLIDPTERMDVLRRIAHLFETKLSELTQLEGYLDTLEVAPEHRDILAYQRATLDYGIASVRHARDWFHERLQRRLPPS